MLTRVNVFFQRCDVYCGRTCGGWVDVGFGNKFRIGVDGDREEVVEKYRRWLWEEIKKEGEVFKKICKWKGDEKLGCWCRKDEKCHVDVLIRCWGWLQVRS